MFFDRGFDPVYEYIPLWIEAGIVVKSGSWFSYEGENMGQGLIGLSEYLKDNQDIFNAIVEEYTQYKDDIKNEEIEIS